MLIIDRFWPARIFQLNNGKYSNFNRILLLKSKNVLIQILSGIQNYYNQNVIQIVAILNSSMNELMNEHSDTQVTKIFLKFT